MDNIWQFLQNLLWSCEFFGNEWGNKCLWGGGGGGGGGGGDQSQMIIKRGISYH